MVNLGKARIDAMLKVLGVEGAVARDGSRGRCLNARAAGEARRSRPAGHPLVLATAF
jgi:hypothetical protein